MSSPIISVKNIGKKYKLGATLGGRNYKTLRDVLTQAAFSPYRKLSAAFRKEPSTSGSHSSPNNPITQLPNNSITKSPNNPKEFWALKDISFDVQEGDVIGIIGRNGAGKSTLLKIVCGITEPTEGEIFITGRVASLLEVGTGFHPELSGRENVFMNGAILGMTKAEIRAKFDEIVAFAEVEKFIDTPVKRYSSGMYVRLAFAVAAYLEPEILVIDEVLAVGDGAFQKKCLGKMEDVAKGGRTVLFVSHNMVAVEALCSKAMIISEGRNSVLGSTPEIIKKYLEEISKYSIISINDRKDRRGKGNIKFKEIRFTGSNGDDSNIYAVGDDIYIYMKVESFYPMDVTAKLGLSIRTTSEVGLISCDSALKNKIHTIPGFSESTLVCKVYSPPLNHGNYYVNLSIFRGNDPEDWITSAAKFSIESGTFDDRVKTDPFPVLSRFEWDIER